MHIRSILVWALAALPTLAAAVPTLDEIGWPAGGTFPAYPEETDPSKVRFSASAGVVHDSNLFRLDDVTDAQAILGDSKRSDDIGRLGLGVRADLPASRQRFLLDLDVDAYRYQHYDFLDHTGYSARATWRWVAGDQLDGDLRYTQERELASFGDIQARLRDLVTAKTLNATGGIRVTPRWRVRGGLYGVATEHSEETRSTLDARIDVITVGVDYLTPANSYIGLQTRRSHGRYPNRLFIEGVSTVDNEYTQTDTSAVARWVVSGKSRLDAELGYTQRRQEHLNGRDFDGPTGRIGWDWTPGAKTGLYVEAYREVRPVDDVVANYAVTRGAAIAPRWAPSVGIVLQARLFREERDFRGDPGLGVQAGTVPSDTTSALQLALGWAPGRHLQILFALEGGTRESNVVGRDYEYNQATVQARYNF